MSSPCLSFLVWAVGTPQHLGAAHRSGAMRTASAGCPARPGGPSLSLGARPPPRPRPPSTRPPRPDLQPPLPPPRDPSARPHPARRTHPCSAPRRSGRASGRCALRRDRRQVSGCAWRQGSGRRASTHRLQERWSPPALPWRRRRQRRRWRRRRRRRRTRAAARRAAWSRSGPGGGSAARLRPSACRLRTRTAGHGKPRPACAGRSRLGSPGCWAEGPEVGGPQTPPPTPPAGCSCDGRLVVLAAPGLSSRFSPASESRSNNGVHPSLRDASRFCTTNCPVKTVALSSRLCVCGTKLTFEKGP